MRRCKRTRCLDVGTAILTAIALAWFSSDARSQDAKLKTTIQSGHELVINQHAWWNRDCSMWDLPHVHLEKAPKLGEVCARIADVKVRQNAFGSGAHCIGRTVQGVHIVYHAQHGAVGVDDLRYAAQFGINRRTIGVTIDVRAGQPPARDGLPKELAGAQPGYVQPLVRMPLCTEFVS
jgi:hypothetical protein